MNIGELKELIKDVPNDTPIATYRSNMEGSGYTDKYIRAKFQEMFKYKETRVDAFDGTEYTEEILSPYPRGNLECKEVIKCMVIE